MAYPRAEGFSFVVQMVNGKQSKPRSQQPKQIMVQLRCVELSTRRDLIRHTFLMVVIKLSHGNADPAFATLPIAIDGIYSPVCT